MRYVMLLILILALAGCGDDDYNGGEPGGGNYETYWGVTEAFSTKGYVPEMTQKPESPAPPSDQKDCPSVLALLILLGGLWGWQRNQKLQTRSKMAQIWR